MNVKLVSPCLRASLPGVCLDNASYATGSCVCATVAGHLFKASSAKPPLTCARVCLCVHVCVSAGMLVSATKDGSGMLVRSVVQGGCISHDGRLGVGDAILAINGEPASNLSHTRARAMLRRHSVLGPEMR